MPIRKSSPMHLFEVLRRVLRREDGRLRSPGQLLRALVAYWSTAVLLGEPSREAQEDVALAERTIGHFAAAGGGHGLERVARTHLVTALRQLGREDEAADEARWLTDTPDAPGIGWTWLAMRYLRAGRLFAAERALENAREGHAAQVAAALRAVIQLARGEHTDAAETAARVIDTAGSDPPLAAMLHAVRAQALASVNRPAEALADLAAAEALVPALGPAMAADRAEALARLGRTEEAIALLMALRTSDPQDEALRPLLVLARLLDDNGNEALLAEVLAEAMPLAQRSGLPVVRLGVALSLARSRLYGGAPEAAAAMLREALGDLEAGRGPLRSTDPLEEAAFMEPMPEAPERPTPDWLVEAWRTLGEALEATHDREGASVAYQTALGLIHGDLLRRGPDAVDEHVERQVAAALRAVLMPAANS